LGFSKDPSPKKGSLKVGEAKWNGPSNFPPVIPPVSKGPVPPGVNSLVGGAFWGPNPKKGLKIGEKRGFNPPLRQMVKTKENRP